MLEFAKQTVNNDYKYKQWFIIYTFLEEAFLHCLDTIFWVTNRASGL